jgi:antitoxin HicB
MAKRPTDYPFSIRPLTADEGGGYLIEYPDLPGCMSDGETPVEAMRNGEDAKRAWISAMRQAGRAVPPPSSDTAYSGKWVMRVPRTLHRRLSDQAKRDGVSLNTLAATYIAEGLGETRSRRRA